MGFSAQSNTHEPRRAARLLALLLALVCCLPLSVERACAAPATVLSIRNDSRMLRSGSKFRNKPVHCLLQRSKVYAGYLERKTRPRRQNFLRIPTPYSRTERSKLNRIKQTCRSLLICNPQITVTDVSILENSTATIPVQTSTHCASTPLRVELVTAPTRGEIESLEPAVRYRGTFGSGTDSLQLRACTSWGECSAAVTSMISLQSGTFTGRPFALTPYKNSISEKEARYLLNKVAFGGCENLVQIGVQQGLSALVDALLDERYGGCTYALPLSSNSGYNTTMDRPDNVDPDAFAYWMSHPAHEGGTIDYWRDDLLFRTLALNARYNSPLREYMTLMFWHQNFPASFLNQKHDGKLHYNTLSSNALGHFGNFFRAFFGPLELPEKPSESVRIPGVDPLLDFNPDRATDDGVFIYPLSGPYRAYGDKVLQTFLNNETNSVQSRNENLARELNEIFVAGTHDLVTGERNYHEEDVITTTYGITGLAFDYDGAENADGNPNVHRTATGADAAGGWRYWLGFFASRTNLIAGTVRTLFSGTPWERSAVFSIDYGTGLGGENIIDYLLNEWPASSRRLAGKLLTQLVNPHLMQETEHAELMVQALRAQLLTPLASPGEAEAQNYNIREALRTVLKSEAFFSREAYHSGHPAPFENIFSFLRNSNLPTVQWSSFPNIQEELERAGHLPGQPPSVFGWPSYGVPGSGGIHDGREWLNPTPLLGVVRAILQYLDRSFLPVSNPADAREVLFPAGRQHCNESDHTDCPTASEMLDHILKLFNLDGNDPDGTPIISAEERQILLETLDPADSPWSSLNVHLWGRSHARLLDLLYLVGTHPARFLK